MSFRYPVFLEIQGRRAVVIGETAVREGKVEALRAAGAEVAVFENSAWTPVDLDGAFIVVASSDDPGERAAIAREARARGALVNVMDDVANCDWAAPAIVRRGDLVVAISTGGRSPALARRLREELAERFGPEWQEILEVVGQVRAETLASLPDLGERVKRWRAALDIEEAEALVRAGRTGELRDRLRARLGARA